MKCNHKKVMSKFCPECGERVHHDVVKSEILLYMKERLDVCVREIPKYKTKLGKDGYEGEQAEKRLRALDEHIGRWNRWIEWLMKQENNP